MIHGDCLLPSPNLSNEFMEIVDQMELRRMTYHVQQLAGSALVPLRYRKIIISLDIVKLVTIIDANILVYRDVHRTEQKRTKRPMFMVISLHALR